ncbi:MAG: hypothetical protein NT041_00045, partial [Candidatus Vogelbacteria bacterium]|nr:hypothetical protein [Candidatus Vogelbacteria bacterium]
MAGESFDVLTSPPSGDTDFPNVAKAAEEAGKIVDQLDTPLVIPETPVIEVEEPEEPAELTTIHN